eukprot:6177243-Pleurochrysis_carterae.AAC.1
MAFMIVGSQRGGIACSPPQSARRHPCEQRADARATCRHAAACTRSCPCAHALTDPNASRAEIW